MGTGALPDPTFYNFALTQDMCSPIFLATSKFLKAGCLTSRALFEMNGIVRQRSRGFISYFYSQITSSAAEDPVGGTAEESRGQYAPFLMDNGCC